MTPAKANKKKMGQEFMLINGDLMNDFPVIGYPCFAHRILGSPGGKHYESLKEMYGVELFLR